MCTHNLCLSKNKKLFFFHLKIIIFAVFKNLCILHGHVCVMVTKHPEFQAKWPLSREMPSGDSNRAV